MLTASLAPIGHSARALGADEAAARALEADAFTHAVGLLVLQHTGRIRLYRCTPRALMAGYVDGVVERLAGAGWQGAGGRP